MQINKTKAIIEAILFSAGREVKKNELMLSLEVSSEEIDEIITLIQEDYKNEERGIELIKINDYTLEELETKVKRNGENVILKLALINKLGKIKNKEIMIKEKKFKEIFKRHIFKNWDINWMKSGKN